MQASLNIPRRILVCGGRDFGGEVAPVLDRFLFEVCITGGARGADFRAYVYAVQRKIPVQVYPAQWDRFGRKAAGPIRNRQMLVEGRPDLVIAFPGGYGTANMCEQAAAAGVEVYRVTSLL